MDIVGPLQVSDGGPPASPARPPLHPDLELVFVDARSGLRVGGVEEAIP
jgi:hypothetical protein